MGKAETSIAQSTRGGHFSHKSWGDLPVVVLIGDDMQLPSVNKGTWFLPVGPKEDRFSGRLKPLEQKGRDAFLEAGKNVMELGTVKRQDDSEKDFKEILEHVRNDTLTDANFKYLKKFHLQGDSWSLQRIRELEQDAMFLFSKKDEVVKKICKCLRKHQVQQTQLPKSSVTIPGPNMKLERVSINILMTIYQPCVLFVWEQR